MNEKRSRSPRRWSTRQSAARGCCLLVMVLILGLVELRHGAALADGGPEDSSRKAIATPGSLRVLVEPAGIDFGVVMVGASAKVDVLVRSSCQSGAFGGGCFQSAVRINAVPPFSADPESFVLTGSSREQLQTVSVTFSPTMTGFFAATLNFLFSSVLVKGVASVDGQPRSVFDAIGLTERANRDIATVYPNLALGDITLGGIPFTIPPGEANFFSTRTSEFPVFPESLSIPVYVAAPLRLHLLVNFPNTFEGSAGLTVGAVELVFADGSVETTPLRLGENVRDVAIGAPVLIDTTTDPASREVHREPAAEGEATTVLDLLSIDILNLANLIEVRALDFDISVGDNPLNLFGITVEHALPEDVQVRSTFVPVGLTTVANRQIESVYPNLPLGDVTLGGIPFTIPPGVGNFFSTQASVLPDFPTRVNIPANVPKPLRFHLLLNSGNTFERFDGVRGGKITLRFEDGLIEITWLDVGEDVRDVGVNIPGVIGTTTDPLSREVYREPAPEGEPTLVLDLLSIEIDKRENLIEVIVDDVSASRTFVSSPDLDPALNIFGMTVEREMPEDDEVARPMILLIRPSAMIRSPTSLRLAARLPAPLNETTDTVFFIDRSNAGLGDDLGLSLLDLMACSTVDDLVACDLVVSPFSATSDANGIYTWQVIGPTGMARATLTIGLPQE